MQSQNDMWIPVFLVAVIAIVILAWVWHFSRARSVLRKWADDNGYQFNNGFQDRRNPHSVAG